MRGCGEVADPNRLNMGETVYGTYQVFERNDRAAGIAVTGIRLGEKPECVASLVTATPGRHSRVDG